VKLIREIVEREMKTIVSNATSSSNAPSRGEEPFDFIGEALAKRDKLKAELDEAQRCWDVGQSRKGARKAKPAPDRPTADCD